MVWNESISGSLAFCESNISAKTLVLKLRPKIVTTAKTLDTKLLLLAWISPVFMDCIHMEPRFHEIGVH